MNSRKIIKTSLAGCDREEVAKAVGMSLGSLNNLISGELPYQPKGRTPNFLDRTHALIDITLENTGRAVVLEKLAEEFGFILIANPTIYGTESPAVSKISEILREFSAVIDEMVKANADGVIERWEGENIRSRWEITKRIIEEFVLACETGLYGKKREPGKQ